MENLGFVLNGLFVSYSSSRRDDGTLSYRAFVSVGNNVVKVTSKSDIFADLSIGDEVSFPVNVGVYEGRFYCSVSAL